MTNTPPNTTPSPRPVKGIRLGTAAAGIRQHTGLPSPEETQPGKTPVREDLVLVEIAQGAATTAVFTRNAFCAAPVHVARRHLGATSPRFLLINSGNANAGTGQQGTADAMACCAAVAQQTGCPPEAVLPFSTGVIGELLPVAPIRRGIGQAHGNLHADGWDRAARAIMTTDTVPKYASRTVETPSGLRGGSSGGSFTITGIAKGAGMIRPDMATMLAFVATDAPVTPAALGHALASAVERSFHRITVDGDTSTNDACVLMATGMAPGMPPIDDIRTDAGRQFQQAVTEVCQALAKALIRDGEGATKFITIEVQGGKDRAECDRVAFTIAHSPLVKTAFFAADPNWGRILAAVGRAGLPDLDISGVRIFLLPHATNTPLDNRQPSMASPTEAHRRALSGATPDDVCIVTSGMRSSEYTEQQGQRVMQAPEITVRVELGRGKANTVVWTCDLSHDYVRINAEYRT
uniref:Arginine biosynthesis bifunctional protein ArgJ n=1 Tax=Candidatus Kentrum sp. FM TaxID=2126340 RepID=A0A450TE59_9GAMM|nr:MAG: glutamate N-acetyltransferase / amino-acid N-acetyltransferase [Candidatus Kentron sp. FM]VFJ67396.1 MAG: glutamate N-acetyltransferase / amino-acid N-acetyltransferase [Candidatus Kentron sp. FM]VFK16244.1 MAG: glutamate N-acetyltransferase / amino-acid N-acetyltransferase [Candidatus Kentron sp. FM]